jgi:hypothetical protein
MPDADASPQPADAAPRPDGDGPVTNDAGPGDEAVMPDVAARSDAQEARDTSTGDARQASDARATSDAPPPDATDAAVLRDGSPASELCTDAIGSHLHMQGTLAGTPVDVAEDPVSGDFENGAPGTLDLPSGTAGPDVLQVHLTWPKLVLDDATTTVQGTVRLRTTDPSGGSDLCAGPGSTLLVPSRSDPHSSWVTFRLVGLTRGPACTEPVTGELAGCWSDNTAPRE